jgi:hypothetical protein
MAHDKPGEVNFDFATPELMLAMWLSEATRTLGNTAFTNARTTKLSH